MAENLVKFVYAASATPEQIAAFSPDTLYFIGGASAGEGGKRAVLRVEGIVVHRAVGLGHRSGIDVGHILCLVGVHHFKGESGRAAVTA